MVTYRRAIVCALLLYGSLALLDAKKIKKSDFPDKFYLYPRSTFNCKPSYLPVTADIDKEDFKLTDMNDGGVILSFPGCFTLDAKLTVFNTTAAQNAMDSSLVAYYSWEWDSAPADWDFTNVECVDTDARGCGGSGNRCYYCDFCESIQTNKDISSLATCPKKAGIYPLKTSRCINDYGSLDKDKDGRPDFLDNPKYAEYKDILEKIEVIGWGRININVILGTSSHRRVFEAMRQDRKGRTAIEFGQRFLDHWMPTLNKKDPIVACFSNSFDICKKKPDPTQVNTGCL